jgi:hypothetical protein
MNSERIRRSEAFFWIVLGVAICFLGWRIKIGNFHGPGPGFFALVAGLALVIIGTFMLFSKGALTSQGTSKAATGVSRISGLFKLRLIGTMVILVAYGLFLNAVGYLLCTFLVMCGLFYDWGKNRLLNAVFASVVTTAVTYLIFETWLHTQLPRGILPWW